MGPRYYLALFNEQSWKEFLDHDTKIYGTNKSKLNRAKKVHSGDYLLCYISKISVFSGILTVNSETYYDESEYWTKGIFPVRLNVQPEVLLSAEEGLPIYDLRDSLQVFKNLKRETNWASFFINAFNEFPKEDGTKIVQKLRDIASEKR